MSISLYQATIPSFRQIVKAVIGLIDKAEAYCTANNLPAEELVQARLAEDMLPFAYQIAAVCKHSLGAVDGAKKGVYSPVSSAEDLAVRDFDSLRGQLAATESGLRALSVGEVNALVGKPMRFEFRDIRTDFVAEEFLLSFSQPNFYFHATTAYDILRWKGLDIGKRDFIGEVRSI